MVRRMLSNSNIETCKYCSKEVIGIANMARHEDTCRKHPGAAELKRLFDDGLTYKELCAAFAISATTLRNWVKSAGLKRNLTGYKKRKSYRPGPASYHQIIPDDHPDLEIIAPAYPHYGTCPECEYYDQCKIRMFPGLWACCEKPSEYELNFGMNRVMLDRIFSLCNNGTAYQWTT